MAQQKHKHKHKHKPHFPHSPPFPPIPPHPPDRPICRVVGDTIEHHPRRPVSLKIGPQIQIQIQIQNPPIPPPISLQFPPFPGPALRTGPQVITADVGGFIKVWDLRMLKCTETLSCRSEPPWGSYKNTQWRSFCYLDGHNRIICAARRKVCGRCAGAKAGLRWTGRGPSRGAATRAKEGLRARGVVRAP